MDYIQPLTLFISLVVIVTSFLLDGLYPATDSVYQPCAGGAVQLLAREGIENGGAADFFIDIKRNKRVGFVGFEMLDVSSLKSRLRKRLRQRIRHLVVCVSNQLGIYKLGCRCEGSGKIAARGAMLKRSGLEHGRLAAKLGDLSELET
ncbi:hypothetical protein RRG08_044857 [Elysia crispata]|uniref:Uncharacterized protein n=1 Tax=Elysia crispata TaxID=231223 RepID=A0AAE1DS00_9GAST|nr:hypothetical protein RRG08_044857 [Elysia crispata]